MVENVAKIQDMKVLENNAKRDQSRGRHPKGTTFGKRDGPDEENYGRNEGFHEKSKPCG